MVLRGRQLVAVELGFRVDWAAVKELQLSFGNGYMY